MSKYKRRGKLIENTVGSVGTDVVVYHHWIMKRKEQRELLSQFICADTTPP